MKFWIVTPSYNQLEWLKLCVKSVADQATDGVKNYDLSVKQGEDLTPNSLKPNSVGDLFDEPITVHHHIQDALSSDGTQEFLKEHEANSSKLKANGYTFSYESEKDEGMYDAINRGWKLAPDDVDVIAHLNCDEQYLPNALQTITAFFKAHQKADVVFADMIVADAKGNYICHRRSLKPYAWISRFCCAGFTATTFQRASVAQEKKVFFDTSWRNFGDKVWYNTLHQAGCRFAVCNQLVSVFTDTGENLNWTEEGLWEKRQYEEKFLKGSGVGTKAISRINGIRRLMKEKIIQVPKSYALYRPECSERSRMTVINPRGLWHKKWKNT